MFRDGRPNEGGCCSPPIKGLRRLTFPDGTQVGITGLDAVLEDLYREGRPADAATAAEIVERLKSENYIEPSARPAYEELFLKEYDRLLRAKSALGKKMDDGATASHTTRGQARKRGLFRLLKGDEEPTK